jgi:L-lactate dehydrogenase complex protein LldG
MTGTGARAAVLSRIRAATADVPEDEAPAWEGIAASSASTDDLAGLFAARVAEYRATVTPCGAEAVASAVATVLSRHGATSIAVPAGLPAEWVPAGVEVMRDDPPLAVRALDGAGGALTGAALGIAETGTVVLDGASPCGRRALTLVPDLHVCVVRGKDVVGTVAEAFAALAGALRAGRPLTLVSGPSATSDIELRRVEGVHGPRRLEVVLVIG